MSDGAKTAVRAVRVAAMAAGLVLAQAAGAPAAAQFGAPPGEGGSSAPDNRGVRMETTREPSPAYRESLDEGERARADEARRSGESYTLPVIGPGREVAVEAEPAPSAQERAEPVYEPAGPAAAARGEERPRAVRREGGGDHVHALIEALSRPPAMVRLRYPRAGNAGPGGEEDREGETAEAAEAGLASFRASRLLPPGVRAGRGFYARVMYEVNSDYPGPVLLELLEPPLVGAVVRGTFTRVRGRMVLRLTSLEHGPLEDGQAGARRRVPVEGWGVGLDCACYGLEGEVDRHWVERVLLPAAFSFAEGFFGLLGQTSRSVSVLDGGVLVEETAADVGAGLAGGAAAAARSLGEVLLEDAPDGPTVRLPRDTELVVVFTPGPETAGSVEGAGVEGAGVGAPAYRDVGAGQSPERSETADER